MLEFAFLHPTSDDSKHPRLAVLFEDVNGSRRVRTYQVNIENEELISGTATGPVTLDVSDTANKLIAVESEFGRMFDIY